MENKKILLLNLKRKWFEMILSGEKKEEYREIKTYWEKRLLQCNKDLGTPRSKYQCKNCTCSRCILEHNGGEFIKYDYIKFRNGYSKNAPEVLMECKNIKVGKAKGSWSDNWKGNVFIIELGEKN